MVRATLPSHIPGEVTGDADGIPQFLRRFVNPTSFGVDNDFESHIYNDFGGHDGYRRFVSSSSSSALSTDKHQQLLEALSSLESRIDLIIICSSYCSKCKKVRNEHDIDFLADSSASLSFMPHQHDLTESETIIDDGMKVQTASKDNQLKIVGKGLVFFSHFVKDKGRILQKEGCLYPVFYIPGLSIRLLSVSSLLNDGLELRGTSESLEFKSNKMNWVELV